MNVKENEIPEERFGLKECNGGLSSPSRRTFLAFQVGLRPRRSSSTYRQTLFFLLFFCSNQSISGTNEDQRGK